MGNNWDIIGHERALAQLSKDIKLSRLSHAYLFSGPKNIGKASVAKKMAKILQCSKNGCNECKTCLQVEKMGHSDTSVYSDDGEIINLEMVREIISKINLTPQSEYKIFILQNIERMNRESANSFLKALEEPPQRSVIILTTSNSAEVLPTIISRSRVINFYASEEDVLAKGLKKLFPKSDADKIKKVTSFSMGRAGKAVSLLSDDTQYEDFIKVFDEVEEMQREKNIAKRFSYVDGLCSDVETKNKRINLFLNVLNFQIRENFLQESDAENKEKHVKILSKIAEAGILFRRNVNNRLFLENLMLNL